MTETNHPAAWHPDPSKRHQSRYWDGQQWTERVADNGQEAVDTDGQTMANTGISASPGFIDGEAFSYTTPEQVQAQVAKAMTRKPGDSILEDMRVPEPSATDVPPPEYGKSIFTEKILVVNQKAKILELSAEYGVFDQDGNQIGAVREVGQSTGKKVARALTPFDSSMTHTLDVVDMSGNLQLRITKPMAIIKPKVIVQSANGETVGTFAMKFRIGKLQVNMFSGDQQVGTVHAENFRAWNFKINDASGEQIGSITKTWEGLGKAMFTNADNYVVQIHKDLANPLLSLVLATSLAIDLMIKQN